MPMRLIFVVDAEALEQRHVERQQRFADVEARMAFLLHHDHVAAALGQQGRDGGAGGAAADDEHVAMDRLGLHRLAGFSHVVCGQWYAWLQGAGMNPDALAFAAAQRYAVRPPLL